MAIELDMEKILSQPSEEEKQTELTRQIYEGVQSFDRSIPVDVHTDALIGFVSSLAMNLMLVRKYCDYISNGFNEYADAMNQLTNGKAPPVMLLNFGDFSDTHGMSPEKMKEWLEQRNEAWRNRERKKDKRIISLGN